MQYQRLIGLSESGTLLEEDVYEELDIVESLSSPPTIIVPLRSQGYQGNAVRAPQRMAGVAAGFSAIISASFVFNWLQDDPLSRFRQKILL